MHAGHGIAHPRQRLAQGETIGRQACGGDLQVGFGVAAAEVGYLSQWQRSELGFAAVAGSPGHVEEVLDSVERFVWSQPEVEVVGDTRCWLESE